jgi:methyl-accepting chemotaxis protein
MTIAQRLYAFILVVVIGLLTLATVGISQMAKVYEGANYANVNTVPSMLALDVSFEAVSQLRVEIWQYLSLKPSDRSTMVAEMEAQHKKLTNAFIKYEKEDISNQADKDLLRADREALADYDALYKTIISLADQNKVEEARDTLLANKSISAKLVSAIDVHRQFNTDLGLKASEDAAATLTRSNWLAVSISSVVIVVVASMGLMLTKKLIRSLTEAVKIAKTVAGGDLTYDIVVTSTDETGQLLQALKEMNDSLIVIIGEVRSGTDTIATASGQIASGNLDLSSRTEEQASSLEETASSMEELTSTVQQNAANAQKANDLAVSASDVASKGGAVVSQVISTMGSIDASARKIVEIISVIGGIAFQTNILALNAAVEAARAGEQGRGFAVVATEVRNLAHRSAAAAKEIKTLISESVEQVDAGSKLVTVAGATMDEVVSSVKRVTEIISEISTAGREQTSGIQQINQAITQMDSVTQQNAALVEEAAAAAASLQDQAGSLSELVSTFKVNFGTTQASKLLKSKHISTPSKKPMLVLASAKTVASSKEWESY